MVKTLCLPFRGLRLILGWGTLIPYAVRCSQKKKKVHRDVLWKCDGLLSVFTEDETQELATIRKE